MRVLAGIGAVAAVACLAATAASARPALASSDPVVSPGNLQGWHLTTNNTVSPPYDPGSVNPSSTASFSFQTGPGHPPAGNGSLLMSAGDAPNSRVAAVPPELAGSALSDLDSLSYDTYLTNIGSTPMPINFKISLTSVKLDEFTTLVFEPTRQSDPVVAAHQWQTWDTLTGEWWATGVSGICSQSQPCSWRRMRILVGGRSTIRVAYFELGDSGTGFSGTDCALDEVVINRTTYNMEPDRRDPRTPHSEPLLPAPRPKSHPPARMPCRTAAYFNRVAVTKTNC